MTQVDLITGFLGAGKTTYIAAYRAYLDVQGIEYCIIENEFGMAGVDAVFLGGDANIVELSGGCICCTQKVGFHDALVRLAHAYQRVIVEPSGVFNPEEFFEIMASPQVAACARIGSMITVVDAASLEDLSHEDAAILAGELMRIGRIVLSKAEVTQERLSWTTSRLGGILEAYSPDERQSLGEKIYPKGLMALDHTDFQHLMSAAPTQRYAMAPAVDHARLFQSCTYYPKGRFSAEDARAILMRILGAGRVLRVKGYLTDETGNGLLINYATGGQSVTRLDHPIAPMINIIGRELRRAEIKRLFDRA